MKKSMRTTLLFGLVLVLVAALLTSCASKPANLEEYINSNSDAKQQIEALSSGGLEVSIQENTLTYTYTYPDTIPAEAVTAMIPEIETMMESQSTTFTTLAETLESESGLTGVSVKVVYLNGDGSEIFTKTYE